MKLCRALVRFGPLGAIVRCGKPAFQIRDGIPVCFECLKLWKERQKAK